MSRSRHSTDLATEEQASLWAARLEGSTLDSAGRASLDAWLGENPVHRALLSRYCQLSLALKEQLPDLADAGFVPVPDEILLARSRWQPRWIATVALAAAALVVLVLWLSLPGRQVESIATTAGQRRSFVLNDGSRVELNASTNLFIENSRAERRVRFDSGEAFFVVSRDKSRPFIVTTPAGTVRVTGTIFNVRSESSSELVVTVVEGSVQVRPGEMGGNPPSAAASLVAGDQLTAGPDGVSLQALSRAAEADALAWRHGQIVFDSTPLREALARYSRYSGRELTVTAAAANLSVGGRYGLDDLDGFFKGIVQFLPVHVTRLQGGGARVSLLTEKQ